MLKTFSFKKITLLTLIFLLAAFSLAACQPAASEAPTDEHAADHEHEMDHEHESDTARVPNDGAVVHLVSPADGATFKAGEDIVVEIEVENFDLNAEGNHWHLYVDGSVLTMVQQGAAKTVIHGLEAGEHHIEVYLGLPTHEELEEGAMAMINVEE